MYLVSIEFYSTIIIYITIIIFWKVSTSRWHFRKGKERLRWRPGPLLGLLIMSLYTNMDTKYIYYFDVTYWWCFSSQGIQRCFLATQKCQRNFLVSKLNKSICKVSECEAGDDLHSTTNRFTKCLWNCHAFEITSLGSRWLPQDRKGKATENIAARTCTTDPITFDTCHANRRDGPNC